MTHQKLVQFAKWPRKGKVKTRLAKSMGEDAALEAHISLYKQVVSALSAWPDVYEVHFDTLPNVGTTEEQVMLPDGVVASVRVQVAGCLGDKMAAVLESASADQPVVIVGSDCPVIDTLYISRAFALLKRVDVVLGPAEDGGFVLIGARKFNKALFEQVEWGGGGVYAKTCSNAAQLGLSVEALDTLWDVDEIEDWQRWCAYQSS